MPRDTPGAPRVSDLTVVPAESSSQAQPAEPGTAGLDGPEDEWYEDVPIDWWPAERKRLFVVIGWAAGGFVATAALAAVFARMAPTLIGQVGLRGASTSVVAGLAVFAGVVLIARHLTLAHRRGAHVLLWGAALVYAVLINVFGLALDLGDAEVSAALSGFVAAAVLGVGAAVLLVVSAAAGIGFEDPGRTLMRWGASVALLTVPVVLIEPGVWWMGVLGGCLLAWAVDAVVMAALDHPQVPEPALAACLVAGIAALVLLVAYLVVRHVLRFMLTLVAVTVRSAP